MGGDARPAQRWHGHPPDVWGERWGVPVLRIFEHVDSTNDAARALADEGAPTGTTVLADLQTRGRGRRGRPWLAEPGQALLLSIVFRLSDPECGASVLPLRLGLAVARALKRVAGLDTALKWPNDLLVRDRKVGGILCEGAVVSGRRLYTVAGIGINVLQQPSDWPPELADSATSVTLEAPVPLTTESLMPRLAGEVVQEVTRAGQDAGALRPEELREIRARDALFGQAITVDDQRVGVAAGIDRRGALLVHRDGITERIISGTVRTDSVGLSQESSQT